MDVAVMSLFHVLIPKWTATAAHEKVESWTGLLDAVQQLTQFLDCVLLPHQLC